MCDQKARGTVVVTDDWTDEAVARHAAETGHIVVREYDWPGDFDD